VGLYSGSRFLLMATDENPTRVLVVDDEPQILRVLRRSLESHDFHVITAAEAESALEIMQTSPVQILITDLRMPEMDGVELCRSIRKFSNIPIVVLSVKGEEATKVRALEAGADDYITKPFGMDELVARLRALLRRASATSQEERLLGAGDFRVDADKRRVFVKDREIRLTPKEYDLLLYFLANHSKVLTHRAILAAVWGVNSSEQAEYLRVFVGQLRKKIEVDARSPLYLITERWIGYRFDPAP
jgi:two-component system KDP operon response regulator KdpE